MELHNFWLFAFASLMLNITPGNDMLYVATRSASQGIKAGVISALGVMAGCMVHIIAAVVGLSALIAESAIAFNIVKYLGAAYLIYLGLRALLNKKPAAFAMDKVASQPLSRLFWQGVLTNVLNPKVALFFLAFLPQFINTGTGNTQWQILFLGAWFDVSGTLVNILVAVLFGKLGNWLSKSPRFIQVQEKLTGLILVGLGIKVALSSKK